MTSSSAKVFGEITFMDDYLTLSYVKMSRLQSAVLSCLFSNEREHSETRGPLKLKPISLIRQWNTTSRRTIAAHLPRSSSPWHHGVYDQLSAKPGVPVTSTNYPWDHSHATPPIGITTPYLSANVVCVQMTTDAARAKEETTRVHQT